jgi:hypothetical protein
MRDLSGFVLIKQTNFISNGNSFREFGKDIKIPESKIKLFPQAFCMEYEEIKYLQNENVVQGYTLPLRNVPEEANGVIISWEESFNDPISKKEYYPAIYCQLKGPHYSNKK